MNTISRILCAVDFSNFSRHALDYATAFADRCGAQITVLHAFSAPRVMMTVSKSGGAAATFPPSEPEEIVNAVRRFCRPMMASSVAHRIVVREGPPVAEIIGQAETVHADLVVMAAHGLSGFERLLLGSITENVLGKVRCPVLTIPPSIARPARPLSFGTILCPVDFSPVARSAVACASTLPMPSASRLILLHVLESFADEHSRGETAHCHVPEYRRHLERDAMTRLKEAFPDGARESCRVEKLLATGKVSQEIRRVAAETRADVIVLGVRGTGAIQWTSVSSTIQHVVRSARCPVLTLRSAAYEAHA